MESVLFIVIVGVLCGADGFVQIEQIAKVRRRFIERFVALPAGIPTHDTLTRVFRTLDPQQFRRAFVEFIAAVTKAPLEEVIGIDGKTLRGALNRSAELSAMAEDQVHVVSACSKQRGIVLAQLRSAAKANENKAARELLEILDVKGAIVTMDAAHCQIATINLAVERGAHLIVGLKNNQKNLLKAVTALMEKTPADHVVETNEKNHGRQAHRRYEVFVATSVTAGGPFAAIASVTRVTRTTTTRGRTSTNVAFYASTLAASARLADLIRDRWGIENSLHYCLDVAFDEDGCRVRTGHAAENLSRVRHLALSLMKLAGGPTVGLATRRLIAMGDDEYLTRILRLGHMRSP